MPRPNNNPGQHGLNLHASKQHANVILDSTSLDIIIIPLLGPIQPTNQGNSNMWPSSAPSATTAGVVLETKLKL